jgi:hypothetical protein
VASRTEAEKTETATVSLAEEAPEETSVLKEEKEDQLSEATAGTVATGPTTRGGSTIESEITEATGGN